MALTLDDSYLTTMHLCGETLACRRAHRCGSALVECSMGPGQPLLKAGARDPLRGRQAESRPKQNRH